MQSAPNNLGTYAVEWRDGQPYSTHFQDVFFSSDNGLAETEYVSLQGNNLSTRFAQLEGPCFTIIETGFGTGLNFLCAVKLWLDKAPSNEVLRYISTEKFPLSLVDITAALRLWPNLTALSQPFLAQYPNLLNGKALNLFDNRIQLSLLIGDANETLKHLNIKADAWFLDGFAPSKNPDMWQPALFEQMAALSSSAATFATFTSAGDVRRGLIAAGFAAIKQPGFGKKREMLVGHYVGRE
jgi:tRNA U34 5-methylaminomethyl-2-thiouridine-forming methyltransferase MnmC